MIDTSELHTLILVRVALALRMVEVQESKHFCANFLSAFSTDLDGTWCGAETCGFRDLHTGVFPRLINIQGREPS